MKRLMMTTILVALFLVSGNMHAQDLQKQKTSKQAQTLQQKKQQQFTEIKPGEIPDAVKKAVETNFGKAKIAKAFVNKKERIFKLEIQPEKRTMNQSMNKKALNKQKEKQLNAKNETQLKTVYFTANGKMLKGNASKAKRLKDKGGKLGH